MSEDISETELMTVMVYFYKRIDALERYTKELNQLISIQREDLDDQREEFNNLSNTVHHLHRNFPLISGDKKDVS